MNHRRAITAALLGGALPLAQAARAGSAAPSRRGPALLTLSGPALTRANRGALDPALERLFVKHQVSFARAFEFDAAALQALPAVEIRPTLEYDEQPHRLAGPLLEQVLAAAGVAPDAPVQLTLRALDGYAVQVALADARRWRMVLATQLDGRPLALGGLGPQWAVLDADRLPAFRDKPVKERFSLCPWGLYHVEARAG
ncbi:molybdopterin-dependent oxidoreductase [Azohydromonas caseinilytica]|uniref:Molybdopterin-dependent oxidoreductase n=1 Tax=Azohydromonas caseinilytica TaxID=2728836 RepID=A0A848F709_9BURK|nr:molybdopterin-dependent oxidoreductase [Azohydromonas caseinilytica]NML15897.1 molybdopterin-dependent oxidoreductase [Azohydromonas caseinilytica]